MAASPSLTTWRLLRTLLSASASLVRSTSPGSSSTRRTSIERAPSAMVLSSGKGPADGRARTARGVGARRRVEPDPAAVVFDDLLAHRQADARPRVDVLGMQALEDEEDALTVLGVHPDAVVGAGELPAGAVAAGADVHARRLVAVELDRVADEVLQQLGVQRLVARQARQLVGGHLRAAVLTELG